MKRPSLKKALLLIAIGIPVCVLLFAAGVYSVCYKGFPPDKNGISALRTWSSTPLSNREVYHLTQGILDSTSIFRFQATQEEINTFVQVARMHKVEHTGRPVYWPPFSRPYWFRPAYSSSNRLYRSPEHINNSWVLYYETESKTAYFVYFQT